MTEDPDKTDAYPRYSNVTEQRWDLIAAAVATIGDEIAAGRWTFDPADPMYYGYVTAAMPDDLTSIEAKIIRSWFSEAHAVRVDPWWPLLINGRHRLWNTLPYFSNRLIPISSKTLGYSTQREAEELGPDWHRHFEDEVRSLTEVNWFDRTDPMNARFAQALDEAACGQHPAHR